MSARKRIKLGRIRLSRSYLVREIANLADRSVETVLRWIRIDGHSAVGLAGATMLDRLRDQS